MRLPRRGRARSIGEPCAASGPHGENRTRTSAQVPLGAAAYLRTADALPDDTRIVAPPPILALENALRPLRAKLRERLAEGPWEEPSISIRGDDDLVEEIVRVHDGVGSAVRRFERGMNALGTVIASDAPDARVRRAVRRVEAPIDALLESYEEVREWDVRLSSRLPRDLLTEILRHFLTQVLDWLDAVLEAIADPLAAGKRQGAPIENGKVMLDLRLHITDTPELADLARWVETRTTGNLWAEPSSAHQGTSGRGFGESVAAAVIGFAIGDWLFGGDE